MKNPHIEGPFEVRSWSEGGFAVYTTKCRCGACNRPEIPWPLAVWHGGLLRVPPAGVASEPLLMLLREAKVI
jgi:hypothetical protein